VNTVQGLSFGVVIGSESQSNSSEMWCLRARIYSFAPLLPLVLVRTEAVNKLIVRCLAKYLRNQRLAIAGLIASARLQVIEPV
jgi:hypothetical protein